ncbi:MAG: AbrB/MazE/SpoVT family DNA-binding domain-containing protein [Candidatus Hydrogenedentota bacterium]
MSAKIVPIGNSRGVRIPKIWLDHVQSPETVEMTMRGDEITIRPKRKPRQGWDEQFRMMAKRGDDKLVDPVPTSEWDHTEWEW